MLWAMSAGLAVHWVPLKTGLGGPWEEDHLKPLGVPTSSMRSTEISIGALLPVRVFTHGSLAGSTRRRDSQ